MKIICSYNNGNCNDINFKDFFILLPPSKASIWYDSLACVCLYFIRNTVLSKPYYLVVAAKEKNTRHIYQTYSETRRD